MNRLCGYSLFVLSAEALSLTSAGFNECRRNLNERWTILLTVRFSPGKLGQIRIIDSIETVLVGRWLISNMNEIQMHWETNTHDVSIKRPCRTSCGYWYGTIFITMKRTRGCIMTFEGSVAKYLYSHAKRKTCRIPDFMSIMFHKKRWKYSDQLTSINNGNKTIIF